MSRELEIAGFPITADVNLRKVGSHRDIPYEVANHGRDEIDRSDPEYKRCIPTRGTYCYYVLISEYMLPTKQFEEFWLVPYETSAGSSGIARSSYNYNSPR